MLGSFPQISSSFQSIKSDLRWVEVSGYSPHAFPAVFLPPVTREYVRHGVAPWSAPRGVPRDCRLTWHDPSSGTVEACWVSSVEHNTSMMEHPSLIPNECRLVARTSCTILLSTGEFYIFFFFLSKLFSYFLIMRIGLILLWDFWIFTCYSLDNSIIILCHRYNLHTLSRQRWYKLIS